MFVYGTPFFPSSLSGPVLFFFLPALGKDTFYVAIGFLKKEWKTMDRLKWR